MGLDRDGAPLSAVAEDPTAAGGVDADAAAAPLVLPDASGMLEFLTSALRELEDAQGSEEDGEARGLLAQLEAQLAAAGDGPRRPLHDVAAQQQRGPAAASALAPSDVEIASQIDSLAEQLAAVEAQFAEMGDDARRLVCAGTSVWMGGGEAATAAVAGAAPAAAGAAPVAAGAAAAGADTGSAAQSGSSGDAGEEPGNRCAEAGRSSGAAAWAAAQPGAVPEAAAVHDGPAPAANSRSPGG